MLHGCFGKGCGNIFPALLNRTVRGTNPGIPSVPFLPLFNFTSIIMSGERKIALEIKPNAKLPVPPDIFV